MCNVTTAPSMCPEYASLGVCTCFHVLEIGLNDLVEIVMADGGKGLSPHSTHLHGHNFALLSNEKINLTEWNVKAPLEVGFFQMLDQKGLLKRNFDRPPIKDTMTMPTGGYAVIRFIADNPGFWLLHCHLESHSDTGMMVMLKVGESKDLPPKPADFKKCF
jgi:L-ascorbate oxidase